MDFSKRKLPKEAAESMRICPIDTVKPYAMMLAPVYAYMKLNEKFVSVKAPLDFFTPGELDKLRTFEAFHLPAFVDTVLPFRSAARSVRALLSWSPELSVKGPRKDLVALPPASYELSDAVLRIVGPLWSSQAKVEPFFVAAFVNELCELLPAESLTTARDRSFDLYENAVLGSSWAVFLALHLGYVDLAFLNRLHRAFGRHVARERLQSADGASPERSFDVGVRIARRRAGRGLQPV
jgi:hypothetical protein